MKMIEIYTFMDDVLNLFCNDLDDYVEDYLEQNGDFVGVNLPEQYVKEWWDKNEDLHIGDMYGSYAGKELTFVEWLDDCTAGQIYDYDLLGYINERYKLTPENTETKGVVDEFREWVKANEMVL